jgi:pyridoxamine 5'-phosphate oxidase family protein
MCRIQECTDCEVSILEEAPVSVFTEGELGYLLGERRLARIATVGRDGTPHVTPVGWAYNAELDTIDVGGHSVERTKKFRDAARSGRAAVVIDDVLPPWRPRGVEVRGRAEAVARPSALIRIHPERVVSWGIERQELGARHARDTA